MRILVTGTRYAADREHAWDIYAGISQYFASMWTAQFGEKNALIHGGAPGVDRIADRLFSANPGVEVLEFEADWKTHGKAAGPIRNQKMVDEGQADICVAFPMTGLPNNGTLDCLTRARTAGLRTAVIWLEP